MIRIVHSGWLAITAVAVALLPVSAEGQTATTRAVVGANVGLQATSADLTRVSTIRVYQEDGALNAGYRVDPGPTFDVAGSVQIRPRWWAGAAVSHFSTSPDATVTAEVPHPFFFNRRRTVEGTAADMTRTETAVHVSVLWDLDLSRRWQFKVFGGPSLFRVRQGLVTGVQFQESFPFDTASYTDADVEERSASVVGFHAGVDGLTYFTPRFGVGVMVRYSRGEVTFGDAPAALSATTGGVHVAGGVRIRF